ncbi:MAG TPA: hypothetical protein VG964_04180 [Candidatus Saccharimonadales bacterium]|nr:hypothetical protein [Candidatus Saccharimonadales bacterium]
MEEPQDQPDQNEPSAPRSKQILLVLVPVLLAVGIGAVAYLVFFTANNPSKPYEKGAFNQAIGSLDNYTLSGDAAGQGMSFAKPANYVLYAKGESKDQASFSDTTHQGKVTAPLGAIHVASVSTVGSKTQPANYFKLAFAGNNKAAYQQAQKSIDDFVKGRFSNLYDRHYGTATPFSSVRLKTNAWKLDFDATPQKKYASPILENYRGEIIVAAGQKAYYYFFAYNTTYNWDNNSATWARVFNSLEIDQ